MHQLDQSLPSWSASLDPTELFWQQDLNAAEPSRQLKAPSIQPPSLQGSGRPAETRWHESTAFRDGTQTQAVSSSQPEQIWEPIPSAPSEFREEVLNLFSTNELPESALAKDESAQSAPAPSAFTAAGEKDCSTRRDVSALSRTRSQPHTTEQKQANARESQKRFRQRQKVNAACL